MISKTELFDTHAFVKSLMKVGMKEEQAEVLAQNQLAVLETHIATKADMSKLDKKLTVLGSEITILKWGIGLIIAAEVAPMIKQFFA